MTTGCKNSIHSAQTFLKITNTIAPEHRNNQCRDNLDKKATFKTETSFVRAPLNSRKWTEAGINRKTWIECQLICKRL
ncbi:hypothetical protein PILCRDRAFT_334478 [Piloderma croceum F 1598]|uniref:Uncharacterized protein n=1 Tax=Piloderma croceum (strain F 1598) TaxID=765440 RepID=A0A0C3G2S2_PILCF|nr:hypothetical protein PILCRDRAFT_334478 [Piloderma croceum F 1598]